METSHGGRFVDPRGAFGTHDIKRALVLTLTLMLGCRNEAVRSLEVTNAHVEMSNDGASVNPFGGGEVGKSVFVVGDVTNHGKKDVQFVHLAIDLYRTASDAKPARMYGDEIVGDLKQVPAGATVHFRHYVKASLGGYERCDARVSSATLR